MRERHDVVARVVTAAQRPQREKDSLYGVKGREKKIVSVKNTETYSVTRTLFLWWVADSDVGTAISETARRRNVCRRPRNYSIELASKRAGKFIVEAIAYYREIICKNVIVPNVGSGIYGIERKSCGDGRLRFCVSIVCRRSIIYGR